MRVVFMPFVRMSLGFISGFTMYEHILLWVLSSKFFTSTTIGEVECVLVRACVLHCMCVWVHILYGSWWWKFMRIKWTLIHVNVHLWFFGNWFKPWSILQCSRVEELREKERKVFTLLALLHGRIYGRMISLKYVSGAQFKQFIIYISSMLKTI